MVCCTQRPSSHCMTGSAVGVGGPAVRFNSYQNSPTEGWKNITLKTQRNLVLRRRKFQSQIPMDAFQPRENYIRDHSEFSFVTLDTCDIKRTHLAFRWPMTAGANCSSYTPRPSAGSVTAPAPVSPTSGGVISTSSVSGDANGLFRPTSNIDFFCRVGEKDV